MRQMGYEKGAVVPQHVMDEGRRTFREAETGGFDSMADVMEWRLSLDDQIAQARRLVDHRRDGVELAEGALRALLAQKEAE